MASARLTGTNENISTYGDGTRDYTSLATWEAATDNDLVGTTTSEVLECYADAASFDDGGWTVNGATVNSTYFRIVRAASGHEPKGIPGNGVTFVSTFNGNWVRSLEHYFCLHDVGIKMTSINSASNYQFHWKGNYSSDVGVVGYDTTNAGSGKFNGLTTWTSEQGTRVIDCIIINIKSEAIYINNVTNHTIINNTAVNSGYGLTTTGSSGSTYENNLCYNNTTADFSGTAGHDYNASSDGTASGANSRTNQTFTFVDEGNDDYHLDAADAGAKGFGNDHSATFDDDIDLETITTWSIGADAQVAEVATAILSGLFRRLYERRRRFI